MLPRWLICILRYLNRPMFGTRIIPRNANIDPEQFSEAEFPIYCRQCDYLLRGLPDGRCPECGTPFERARLLVMQYVREPIRRDWDRQRAGRWATYLAIVGLGGLGMWCVGNYAFAWWGLKLPMFQYRPGNPKLMSIWLERLNWLAAIFWYVEGFVLLMLLACAAFAWKAYLRIAPKRARVIDAILGTRQ